MGAEADRISRARGGRGGGMDAGPSCSASVNPPAILLDERTGGTARLDPRAGTRAGNPRPGVVPVPRHAGRRTAERCQAPEGLGCGVVRQPGRERLWFLRADGVPVLPTVAARGWRWTYLRAADQSLDHRGLLARGIGLRRRLASTHAD